jgi:hypothetical protein
MIRFLWGRIPVGLEDDEWTAPDRSSRVGGGGGRGVWWQLPSLADRWSTAQDVTYSLTRLYRKGGGEEGYCPGFLIQLTKYSLSRHLFLHLGFIYNKGCGRWIHEWIYFASCPILLFNARWKLYAVPYRQSSVQLGAGIQHLFLWWIRNSLHRVRNLRLQYFMGMGEGEGGTKGGN